MACGVNSSVDGSSKRLHGIMHGPELLKGRGTIEVIYSGNLEDTVRCSVAGHRSLLDGAGSRVIGAI